VIGEAIQPPGVEDLDYCCAGRAMAQQCTCWTPLLSVEPTTDLQEGPPAIQPEMCGDCAYRKGSREDQEAERPDYSRRERFYCHAGMPAVNGWRHPSIAATLVLDDQEADYKPVRSGDRAWQADGAPAFLCAGWAAAVGWHPRQQRAGAA
jgi:hypothetical protein